MPLTVRAKGVSLSTATNWAFNFLVGEITPYLQQVITWRLYIMHGLFCCCSFVLGNTSYFNSDFVLISNNFHSILLYVKFEDMILLSANPPSSLS